MEKGIPLEDPGDYLLDPVLAEVKHRRRRLRAEMLGIPLIKGISDPDEETPPHGSASRAGGKTGKRSGRRAAAPKRKRGSSSEFCDATFELFNGRNNPYFRVTGGSRRRAKHVGPSQYKILLRLAQQMRQDGRRRGIPDDRWGYVERAELIGLIADRSGLEGNAEGNFKTILFRLRKNLVPAIRAVGGKAEERFIIQNAAPSWAEKRSLYRLTIRPENIELPRS
ncbi:MAG: hypothetical protein COV76_08350 [Candidatus Omnitrophica bacterium CG11_big_fil_rev_8_21_14_0_20_64_10]|nr:MAG: hypothetical protein COV76_08350 [Candidatus Omnitrophica bacterium CG11_big_fil_rev_8_21_14_0_20_64_10]